MRVVVIRHHEEDSAGFIGAAFEARGAQLTSHLIPADGPPPDPAGFGHVVMLGSTSSVYDDGVAREWIAADLALLRRADAAGVPVLGICFGAQLLAAAFGGAVEHSGSDEIGWVTVDSVDHDLIPPGPWFEYHHDRCLPPPWATVLARNAVGVQAFRVGRHLAVQFHPEVDGEQFKLWLDAGARKELGEAGLDPDAILAQTVAEEPAARARAGRLVATALRFAAEAGPGSRAGRDPAAEGPA